MRGRMKIRSFTPEKNRHPSTISTRIMAVQVMAGEHRPDDERADGDDGNERVVPHAQERLLAEEDVADRQSGAS